MNSPRLFDDKGARAAWGFYGEKYNHHEREYKLKGHSLMVSSLDKEGFDSLLASNDYAEICKQAFAVVSKTNLIFPNEKMSFKDGLKPDLNKQLFSERLWPLVEKLLIFVKLVQRLDISSDINWEP